MESADMAENVDSIDQKILASLVADGRQSVHGLSGRVGLSPSPTARRIKRLEDDRVITGYHAAVDESALGFGFNVFVSVRLARQTEHDIQRFESEIVGFREVVDCWLMTGPFDYLIRLSVADLAEFETFLNRKLTRIDALAACESSIPIRRLPCQSVRLR